MVRRFAGIAVVAVLGMVAFKLLAGLVGFVLSLLWSLLWLGLIVWAFYLILRLISPSAARRVREMVQRDEHEDEEPPPEEPVGAEV